MAFEPTAQRELPDNVVLIQPRCFVNPVRHASVSSYHMSTLILKEGVHILDLFQL
jgi:hypothetical protein